MRISRKTGVLAVALTALYATSAVPAAGQQPADLVLRNGKVVTVDAARPTAQAIAVRDARIIAVGTTAEINRYVGNSTRVIDLAGRLAVPGLIEGHGHFFGLGEAMLGLDLMSVRNWDDIVGMVRGATRDVRQEAWIVGRGWHQEKWDRVPQPSVDGVPLHASLDSVSPNNPVILEHASGHAIFVNRRALEIAGITRNTPNPPGGEIVKDARGEPTGLLRENASSAVERAYAQWQQRRTAAERAADNRRMVELASEEALKNGITTFVDAGTGFGTIDFLKALETQRALPIRLYVMVRTSNDDMQQNLAKYLMPAQGNDFLVVRSIKQSIDGALGSHGAWLLAPYVDLPTSTGLATTPPASIQRSAELAIRNGFQLNVHAIGDRANREVLDIYEKTFKANPSARDLRWRIEHAQHLAPSDIPRFGQLGIIASMQGIHASSDGPWVEKKLGPQRMKEGSHVWRSLMRSGAIIANGTDVPVERISPLASFYATVTRMTVQGWPYLPEQRLTREEALKTYTWNNAYATFWEKDIGSIAVGKLADITVLDRDIMTVPEAQIPQARVDYTIVGGQVKYERGTSR